MEGHTTLSGDCEEAGQEDEAIDVKGYIFFQLNGCIGSGQDCNPDILASSGSSRALRLIPGVD